MWKQNLTEPPSTHEVRRLTQQALVFRSVFERRAFGFFLALGKHLCPVDWWNIGSSLWFSRHLSGTDWHFKGTTKAWGSKKKDSGESVVGLGPLNSAEQCSQPS